MKRSLFTAAIPVFIAAALLAPSVSRSQTEISQEAVGALNDEMLTAAQSGDVEKVKSALSRGANVNARNSRGATLLIMAVNLNVKEMVKVALDYKADPNVKDNSGNTAAYYATLRGNAWVVDSLERAGADMAPGEKGGRMLVAAVKGNNTALLLSLVEKGVDFKSAVIDGKPLLIYCLENDLIAMAKILIRKGADVNARGPGGKTALMCAEENRQADMADILRKTGADEKAKDDKGQTAADYSKKDVKREKYFARAQIEVLDLVNFFTVDMKNTEGSSPNVDSSNQAEFNVGRRQGVAAVTDSGANTLRAPFGARFKEMMASFERTVCDEKYKDTKLFARGKKLMSVMRRLLEKNDELETKMSAGELDLKEFFRYAESYGEIEADVETLVGELDELAKAME